MVYANAGSSGEPLIAEGKLVRERQIIIRLPDPKRMQVIARVNESRIDRVKIGMPVRIRLDAFPEVGTHGHRARSQRISAARRLRLQHDEGIRARRSTSTNRRRACARA